MKKLILYFSLAIAFVSCKKDQNGGSPSSDTNNNYAALNLKTKSQFVNMELSGNTLKMTYNEDVTVLIDAKILKRSDAVYLKEDFSGTNLADFDYHSVALNGVSALNWVDDNLDNVLIKSSIDTVIAGNAFVKKHLVRTFNYQKNYDSANEAVATISKLEKQTDIITFSTYSASAKTVNNTAKLTYININKNDVFTEDKR